MAPNHPVVRVASDFEVRYPTSSAMATECAMNLVFTSDLLVKHIASLLQPLNLTPTSGLVLSILADAGSPLPPNEIADRLIISRATVTGLLDSLERREYIQRLPHPTDRRMLLVEIREAGLYAVNVFRPIVHQHQKEWFAVLSETEQQQFIDSLHRLQERLLDSDG